MSLSSREMLGYTFADIAVEIVSTVAGITLGIVATEPDPDFYELTAAMQLGGKNSGTLFISAKAPDLRSFCASMIGVPISEVTSEEMNDALGELVNMVAGNAKLRLGNTAYSFNLTTPFLLKGAGVSLSTKKRIPIIARTLEGEGLSFKLKVIFSQYP